MSIPCASASRPDACVFAFPSCFLFLIYSFSSTLPLGTTRRSHTRHSTQMHCTAARSVATQSCWSGSGAAASEALHIPASCISPQKPSRGCLALREAHQAPHRSHRADTVIGLPFWVLGLRSAHAVYTVGPVTLEMRCTGNLLGTHYIQSVLGLGFEKIYAYTRIASDWVCCRVAWA